jgi:hypothetical protein
LGVGCDLGIEFAEDAVHIVMARADAELLLVCRDFDLEAGSRKRAAGFADHVGDTGLGAVALDLILLIPIGIQLDAALLLEHSVVAFFGFKRGAGEVAFHRSGLLRW